jgi:sugar-specific transcriptional regulator TrmB
MNSALTDHLRALGLKSNEAKAYVALLSHGQATATEVADAAGITRPKVYEALTSLVQMGFCLATGESVSRFRAVEPELALNEWIARRAQERRAETRREERSADEVLTMLPRADSSNSREEGFMEVGVGTERTMDMFRDLAVRAEFQLDIVLARPQILPREAWNQHELEAIGRGVDVRVLYSPEVLSDGAPHLPIQAAGGLVRVADDPPLRLALRDRGREGIVSLVEAAGDTLFATSVAIRHPELVAPFQILFNRQWRQARGVDGADAPAGVAGGTT